MTLQYLSLDKIRFFNIAAQYYEYMCLLRLFIPHHSISLLFTPTHTHHCIDKTNFYDLTDRDMDGNEVKMDKFKGDVLCVVNVASK